MAGEIIDILPDFIDEVETESQQVALEAAKRVGQVVALCTSLREGAHTQHVALHPTDPEQVNFWINDIVKTKEGMKLVNLLVNGTVYEGLKGRRGFLGKYHPDLLPTELRRGDRIMLRLPDGRQSTTSKISRLWLPGDSK